ncbi:patched domain-containing protein 3 [Engraulis encrasicolus]|uniref:patched domain-containing protein 3 n=1 Tax=Engraulis encrasicolus TaxID=184585 RepID=UPI002FD643EB
MPTCKTDCVEKPLSKVFGKFGWVIGKYPWPFFIFPLIISAGLGAGFYFLEDRESNGIEDQFTPKNGPAKTERQFVKEYFPQTDEFSSLRLYTDGTYASIIAVRSTNILTEEALQEILDLDRQVRELKTDGQRPFTFSDLCAKMNGSCVSNRILDIMKSSIRDGSPISYPLYKNGTSGPTEFIGSAIGDVSQDSAKNIEKARAIRLFYYLEDSRKTETDVWLKKFIDTFPEDKTPRTISISYFTSISREEEFDTNSKTVIPLFSVTYFLAITVSIVSCLRLDCVRNKVWVATFGVLSAGLAVLSSFGLLLFCGMPFVMTVATAPFLILGVGVDDMFIMISAWQKTKVKDNVEDRMEETYKEAAVSITITTLTNVLAFYIGLMTDFGSVQSFCMYTGTALLFCYFYSITFFGAFMAFNGRREKSNRHFFTCRIVDLPDANNTANACSVGGAYDPTTGTEEDLPMNNFFKNHYGPFITKPWTKVFVVLIYAGYLAGSIYGCFQMQEGIELKNLAPDDSYVASYYDNENAYFTEYGPFVMLVIRNQSFQYWEQSARDSLSVCLKEFESSEMVAKNMIISWLESYELYGNLSGLNLNSENVFMKNVSEFLTKAGFSQDVNITDGKILASRLFIPTVNISSATDEKDMLNFFRETAVGLTCKDLDALVYHPAFIYYDQYAVIVSNTIQNIAVATVVMLVISLLLIPSPLSSLWVTFAIASVIVGVAGFMALWGVNLDSISMINLVICIGFSVDFSAHISYAFVSSNERTANKKAVDAVYNLGYPIVQGAISTIAGVVVLSAAKSYIFRTFFKIMFLVITFGAFHGIVFIPVFLTFFGCCSDSKNAVDDKVQSPQIQSSLKSLQNALPMYANMMHSPKSPKSIQGHPNVSFDPDCP